MFKSISAAAAAAFLAVASPASASTFLVTVTGDGGTASFNLDTTIGTAVNLSGQNAVEFYVPGVGIPGTLNGVDGTIRVDFFDTPTGGGGFQISPVFPILNPQTPFIAVYGPQIFSGTTANPVFAPGTFTSFQNLNHVAINETLTISNPNVTPLPEPASWALMLFGFMGVGVAMRRRREKHALAA